MNNKEIRINGSMQIIYRHRCHKTKKGLLMLLPRIYASMWGGQCIGICGFKSLLRINGRWTLDSTYFCYHGIHRYKAVPKRLSRKLDCIAVYGYVYDITHKATNKLKICFWAATYKTKTAWYLVKTYKERRQQKEYMDRLIMRGKK